MDSQWPTRLPTEQITRAEEVRRAHYQVVAEQLSQDTIQCLERLLDEARSGQVIGIAFAALMRRRHYITHACGEVLRDRVYTRGMLRELDDGLRADPEH